MLITQFKHQVLFLIQPHTYGNHIRMVTTYTWQPHTYAATYIWQPHTHGNPIHMATTYKWQQHTHGNHLHMATTYTWQPHTHCNHIHMSTTYICQPQTYLLSTRFPGTHALWRHRNTSSPWLPWHQWRLSVWHLRRYFKKCVVCSFENSVRSFWISSLTEEFSCKKTIISVRLNNSHKE